MSGASIFARMIQTDARQIRDRQVTDARQAHNRLRQILTEFEDIENGEIVRP